MLSSQITPLEKLASLSESETEHCSVIADILKTDDKESEDWKEMIDALKQYPLGLLYALSEKNPEINKLLEENEELNGVWSKHMKQLDYPFEKIVSFDQKTSISVFSQLKCAVLLDAFNKNPDFNNPGIHALLDKACEIGSFQALIQRSNYYSDLITSANRSELDTAKGNAYVSTILIDAAKLRNLYWSCGCIDSAMQLMKTANYLFGSSRQQLSIEAFLRPSYTNPLSFSWFDHYKKSDRPIPITILQTAVENLYIARLILDYPQSLRITEQITLGEGILAGFQEHFSTPEELQKYITGELQNLNICLIESFCRQAMEASTKRVNDHAGKWGHAPSAVSPG